MTHPKFKDIEAALGLADSTARYRFAKRYSLAIGSGDPIPSWQGLCSMLYRQMIAESEKQDELELSDLKAAKLKEEINVLKERYRKLENSNQAKEADLVDVREILQVAKSFSGFIRRAASSIDPAATLTGSDAQAVLNNAIRDFELSASSEGGQ